MADKETVRLRRLLERLYEKYNRRDCIAPDPLQFVYRYRRRADREIVAFLSAALAYGRVGQIERSLNRLFEIMTPEPHRFVMEFGKTERAALGQFKHRFNKGGDIAEMLAVFRDIYEKHGGLEKHFSGYYRPDDENILQSLIGFCNSFGQMYRKRFRRQIPASVGYLIANPAGGSTCKRLNLFLRWMVRSDNVDTGIWRSIETAKLIVPVDTHMHRLCGFLRMHNAKNASMASAIAITERFAEITPDDPVKYDFALSRIGIVEGCTGKRSKMCDKCEMLEFCIKRDGF